MRSLSLAAFLFTLSASMALADPVTVNFSNASASDVTELRLVSQTAPAAGESPNLLAGPLAVSQDIGVQVPVTEGDCLFTLKLTFANGRTQERADLDLCQSSDILIE